MGGDTLITIKRGDTLPLVEAILQDANGVIDLTGAAVRFKVNDRRGQVKINAPAVVVDAPGGSVRYDWQVADTDTAGLYQAEFEITYNTGVITCPNTGFINVHILEDL